jgi:hypothetical protein
MRRKKAMVFPLVVRALWFMSGAFLVLGAHCITGNSLIGWVAAVALALLCMKSVAIRGDQEKRHARAQAKKEVYDNLLDAGSQITINGKEWKKGCWVNPETGDVIAPREELTLSPVGRKPSGSVSLVARSGDAEA